MRGKLERGSSAGEEMTGGADITDSFRRTYQVTPGITGYLICINDDETRSEVAPQTASSFEHKQEET